MSLKIVDAGIRWLCLEPWLQILVSLGTSHFTSLSQPPPVSRGNKTYFIGYFGRIKGIIHASVWYGGCHMDFINIGYYRDYQIYDPYALLLSGDFQAGNDLMISFTPGC